MKNRLLSVVLCVFAQARPAAAQIDIARLQIENSPDVRDWAPTATITTIEFWRGAGIHIAFDKNASWPDVVPPGWDGPVQYTVWMLLQIDGRWYGSGVIECWRDRQSTDDTDVTETNQIARNWLYDSRWGPMQGHQPQAGELVGIMVTAGDARGKDVHGVAERSRIVEIAWPAASGSAATVVWVEGADLRPPTATSVPGALPPSPPADLRPPTATSVPSASPAPPALPALDLSPVLAQL